MPPPIPDPKDFPEADRRDGLLIPLAPIGRRSGRAAPFSCDPRKAGFYMLENLLR